MTTHDSQRTHHRRRGFTLIELLVVIAILFLLIGLVLAALRTGRRGAERADSLNSLRQITSAYIAYTTEHNGRLMPGYIDSSELVVGGGALDIKARLEAHLRAQADPTQCQWGAPLATDTLGAQDTSSYVWRLAPYLSHKWDVFMADYRDKQLASYLNCEYFAGRYGPGTAGPYMGIARVPSFGLNSIFLGGDSTHGPANNSPWGPAGRQPFVASRLADVLNPTKIIVFGASKAEGITLPTATASTLGYCELRAPQVYNAGGAALVPQWAIDTVTGSPTYNQVVFNGSGPAGVPISRLNDDRVPISHLDGSVEAEFLARLAADMSRWVPNWLSTQ